MKEASGNLAQIAAIIDGAPDGFEVLSGNDEDTLPMMGLGATGVISVASHVAGPRMAEMVRAQANGDHTRALKLHLELLPLFKALFIDEQPDHGQGRARADRVPRRRVRLPLVPPTEAQSAELARVLGHLGHLEYQTNWTPADEPASQVTRCGHAGRLQEDGLKTP